MTTNDVAARQESARDMQRYAELVGKTQAIVDLYERHPDMAFARLKAAVAEFQAAAVLS